MAGWLESLEQQRCIDSSTASSLLFSNTCKPEILQHFSGVSEDCFIILKNSNHFRLFKQVSRRH